MLTYLPLQSDPLPIRMEAPGALRVGDTRVTVESVLQCYLAGDSPEAIQDAFPTLQLADVYTVIGHYLRHRAEFDQYLKMYDMKFEYFASKQTGLRERLLARIDAGKAENAALPGG
jgi:uncharacterized protein (DUF433 family)